MAGRAVFEVVAPQLVEGDYLGMQELLPVVGLLAEIRNVPLSPFFAMAWNTPEWQRRRGKYVYLDHQYCDLDYFF